MVMYRYYDKLDARIEATRTVMWLVSQGCLWDIEAAAGILTTVFQSGNKLLLCGNGGSAADCQHLAAEFMSGKAGDKFDATPTPYPAIAITTDTSFLTAYTNDYNFENVFVRQIQALGKEGDVLMGITTSGKSQNVIRAILQANQTGMKTIALTGEGGLNGGWTVTGEFTMWKPTVTIKVPSSNTQYIQEAHLMIEHILWELVVSHVASNN